MTPACSRELASAGRGAARLARLVRDQEVGGSNPLAPTIHKRSRRAPFVRYARVAQLDRASASGAEGRGFESRLAHLPAATRIRETCREQGPRAPAPVSVPRINGGPQIIGSQGSGMKVATKIATASHPMICRRLSNGRSGASSMGCASRPRPITRPSTAHSHQPYHQR